MTALTGAAPVSYVDTRGYTVVVEYGPAGWYWRAIAPNGARVAREAVPGHTRKDAALRAARRLHPPTSTPTS